MIVRVSFLRTKWWTGRTLPRDMSSNFSEADMGEGGAWRFTREPPKSDIKNDKNLILIK